MKKIILLLTLLVISLNSRSQIIDRAKLLSDIKTLSSETFQGRRTGTPGNKLAADFIVQQFTDAGLKFFSDSFKQAFTFTSRQGETRRGTNLIGYILGKTDRVIVISAHYDHLGVIGSQIYHGADDNASGVAALLAFARYFSKHPPENTLLFIAFDAEESGLQGAKAFLAKPTVDKSKITLNINMDMIAHNDKGELYAAGTFKNPTIKGLLEGEDEQTGVKILFGHDLPDSGKDDWTMQSDQGPFAKENIPFVYFGVEDHPDYHKPTDTFENINQDFYYGSATAILKCIVKLDKKWGN